MRVYVTISAAGAFIEVSGPEVDVIFGSSPAGGPLPWDQANEAVQDAAIRFCAANLLPVPTPDQVIIDY